MNKYDDIINLKYPFQSKYEKMSLYNRSAQFAPFSALTGYEDEVRETARLTDKKILIDDGLKSILDNKIEYINKHLNEEPKVIFTYFIKDSKKEGGSYENILGIIRRIDRINGYIILKDKTKIPIDDIINITSDIFKNIEE